MFVPQTGGKDLKYIALCSPNKLVCTGKRLVQTCRSASTNKCKRILDLSLSKNSGGLHDDTYPVKLLYPSVKALEDSGWVISVEEYRMDHVWRYSRSSQGASIKVQLNGATCGVEIGETLGD